MRMLDFARANRLPFTWRDETHATRRRTASARAAARRRRVEPADDRRTSCGRSGSAASWPSRRGRPADRRRRPGRPRRGRLRRLRGARHARGREHRPRRPGRRLAPDRELPRLPRRDQRHRADEPRGLAGAQVRRPHRHAVPRDARWSPAAIATSCSSRRARRSRPGGDPRHGRRIPATPGGRPRGATRDERLLRRRPARGELCGARGSAVVGGGNSAGQAAIWLARGGALVTLLHRRADLRETMSDYLIRELDRYGVAVRDRSEIAELHGEGRESSRRSRSRTVSACRSRTCSSSSARARAPNGSARPSPATTTDSSSPATRREPRGCSRRACPASTPPATSVPDRQTLRHRRRRGIDGGAVRPQAPCSFGSSRGISEFCSRSHEVALPAGRGH